MEVYGFSNSKSRGERRNAQQGGDDGQIGRHTEHSGWTKWLERTMKVSG
jgi:hypothetical protein